MFDTLHYTKQAPILVSLLDIVRAKRIQPDLIWLIGRDTGAPL